MENRNLTVPALAYLGDGVYELRVREYLVLSGITKSGELNTKSQKFVSAKAQSEAVDIILPYLTEEEESIYKRGRNHKNSYHPKSAELDEYRRATGLEVLFGWLYITKNESRISELFDIIKNNLIKN